MLLNTTNEILNNQEAFVSYGIALNFQNVLMIVPLSLSKFAHLNLSAFIHSFGSITELLEPVLVWAPVILVLPLILHIVRGLVGLIGGFIGKGGGGAVSVGILHNLPRPKPSTPPSAGNGTKVKGK